MKFISEYRQPEKVMALVSTINDKLDKLAPTRPLQIMEVCGGHTHTIFRFGLDKLINKGIEFVHGPGCPVCVLPRQRINEAIEIAEQEDVIFCSYGDAIRVPGENGNLLAAKARGADIRIVYSPLDALELAKQNPQKNIVFFAIGFETTTPPTALTLQQAKRQNISNFSVLCHHILLEPALRSVLDDENVRLDGLVAPGHVSIVTGQQHYQFCNDEYQLPVATAGFEPLDFLMALESIVDQVSNHQVKVVNCYQRAVSETGNKIAQQAINDVFTLSESSDWRGLGNIEHSGLSLKLAYQSFDASLRYQLNPNRIAEPEGCRCANVIKGLAKPTDCPLFAKGCTPENPVGALMVSSEGACSAYYQYNVEAKPITLSK
ncbi:hydrogenase formation protein HypD [Vibrio sp. B1Z05]|uniref:hydrogenase formation protein HypD n=1 Tax=Vibrio sp. B1Z05 TaxID=2654980 RepID=UPI00128E2A94|nr:hydrogenase formation protein HypD [Vibrio sp. B1Z05]MPW35783.1 hydrogenase formation protein HypD [Vibrio sp. B1Z05]